MQHNAKYCTVHTFTMQLDACFPYSDRAFIEWNRQNSETTQCACVDIAIQFNSRCSASVPLNNAQRSVATGCGDYWGKRYTHCKAITMYVPCLIFLEHWPNSVCWGSTALLFVFFVCWCICEYKWTSSLLTQVLFSPTPESDAIQNYVVNVIYMIFALLLPLM